MRRSGRGHDRHMDVLENRVLMAASDVVINEIMFNSATSETADEFIGSSTTRGDAGQSEWLEARQGRRLRVRKSNAECRSYLAVASNLTRFGQKYPGVLNVVSPWTGSLSNSSNTIESFAMRQVPAPDRSRCNTRMTATGPFAAAAVAWMRGKSAASRA